MAVDILRWLVKDGEELFVRTDYHRAVGKNPNTPPKSKIFMTVLTWDCPVKRMDDFITRRFIWLGDYHLKGKFSRNTLTKYKIKENLFVVDKRFLRSNLLGHFLVEGQLLSLFRLCTSVPATSGFCSSEVVWKFGFLQNLDNCWPD